MSQIQTKWIANSAVTAAKLSSGAATSTQFAAANGSGGVTYRSLVSGDIPSLATIYLPLAGGTMSGSINMGSQSITSLAAPVNPNDAVTKAYADSLSINNTWKTAALVATTANITLSGEQTIDGFLTSASRVLVKNQTLPANNGIYVSAAGAWTRATDMNTWAQVPGAALFVEEGTINGDLGWVCNSQPGGTIGTTAITFVQFSSAGAYSADNVTLQLVSGVFSVKNGGISNTQVNAAAAIAYSKLALSASIQASDQNSGAATSSQPLFANGTGGAAYRSIAVGDIPTLNQNTTGTAANITATSNSTLTSLPSLVLPASQLSGQVAIANGGTGQATAAAAFAALSPMTTAGDLIYENATPAPARLAIGSTGNVLTVVGGLPAWAAPAASGVSTVGTFNSQTSAAAGLVISGTSIFAQAPTATNPGMVSIPASASGLSLSTAALSVATDGSTAKINGSNQVEALQPAEEQFTLSSTNITNQYVDLAHPIFGSSASVNSAGVYVVGGPEQQKTVDYTVSLTGGAGSVTRISFAGDLATGGNAALVAGDILVVDYSYLA